MIGYEDRIVLVAVSGGADSTCLLHVLASMRERMDIDLAVAHFDHGVRGEASASDAEFVRRLAASYKTPFFTEKINGKTLSEAALREERYAFLARAAKTAGATKIAVAHNLDDQAETVLFRLMRGASMRGVASIRPVNGDIIRPLLNVPRIDIEHYCAAHRLEFVTDSTNSDTKYTRNRIRHKLIPLLEREFNPEVRVRLAALAANAAIENDFLETAAEKAAKRAVRSGRGGISISLAEFATLHPAIAARVVAQALTVMEQIDPGAITSDHITEVVALCAENSGVTAVNLPGDVVARRAQASVVIAAKQPPPPPPARDFLHLDISHNGKTDYGEYKIEVARIPFAPEMLRNRELHTAYFSATALGPSVVIRRAKLGDRFSPLGKKGNKKLSDLFIDCHVGPDRRWETPVVVNEQGLIVWVVGIRTGSVAAIEPGYSGEVVRIRMRKQKR